jgi:FAD dependent oxidoreductase
MNTEFDAIVLGAGIYGLYAARLLGKRKQKIALIEAETGPFQRASYINQARVHHGYHYPRSYSTAVKAAHYFDRFNHDFAFAINKRFKKIYATSRRFSMVSGAQFERFCQNAKIPFNRIDPRPYFVSNSVDAAFETLEYSFDAVKIRDWFLEELAAESSVQMMWGTRPEQAEVQGTHYRIRLTNGNTVVAPLVLNATYASVNQVLELFGFGFELFNLKYEICEMIKCKVQAPMENLAVTVLDGPFFSLMPFGLSDEHTLSAVTFTPHNTSHDKLPVFPCQSQNPQCTSQVLANCNACPAQPATAWKYMFQLARKYLNSSIEVTYRSSLFAIKPIPAASEIDDSRPTLIKSYSSNPTLYSVLSGKINTIYDLDIIFS